MTESIFLVGFMASGKTTVGRKLAQALNLPFIDLDDDIEAAAGCTISELFEKHGETYFRDREHEALAKRTAQAANGDGIVVALGGGAYTFPRNRRLIEDAGLAVWLNVPLDKALARVEGHEHRPLAKDPEKFRELYASRVPHYSHADIHIPVTSDDPDVTVAAIREALP